MDVQLSSGEVVFRLVTHRSPSSGDWQPKFGVAAARALGVPELERLAFSHYLTAEAAQSVNTKGSMVARVTLEEGRFYWARTGTIEGHIDVWGHKDEFPPLAETID